MSGANQRSAAKTLRWSVFLPPFLLIGLGVVLSLVDGPGFVASLGGIKTAILDIFGGVFAYSAVVFLIICLAVMASPLGKVVIGGDKAKPTLTLWQWFTISLCTTVAIGILFWACAEPLYHLSAPPALLGIAPRSPEAARFALDTVFLHWTFVPYAMYALPGVVFALALYNLGQPFSIASVLAPLVPGHAHRLAKGVDAVCLFALTAGMAASLATGVLTLTGGLAKLLPVSPGPLVFAGVTAVIAAAFLLSSITGLLKGIRILSNINVIVFFILAGLVLVLGPTAFIMTFGAETFAQHLVTFLGKALSVRELGGWSNDWTLFYWANWLAWAPVTAVFLGRISYGYSVRMFMVMNLIVPALFGAVWMAIFSGATLRMQMADGVPLLDSLAANGPESVVYAVIAALPMPAAGAGLVSLLFLGTAFLSYVTAADSCVFTMASLSANGMSAESPDPPGGLKILWGVLVALSAWVMVAFAGIDGVRMMSVIGGLPALFLVIGAGAALTRLMLEPAWRRFRARAKVEAPLA